MAEPSHQRGTRLARVTELPAVVSGAVSKTVRRAPRRVRLAAPLAVLATVGVVAVGTTVTGAEPSGQVTSSIDADSLDVLLADREEQTSRSAGRDDGGDEQWDTWQQASADHAQDKADAAAAREAAAEATATAVENADVTMWATTDLNLYPSAAEDAEAVGLVEEGDEVLVTGRTDRAREEIVWDGESRWVTEGHLSAEEPEEAPTEVTGGECTTSSTPSGVSERIAALHQTICAQFPDITSYGGWRGDGDHGRGLALDIMVRGERGWEIAEFIRANYQTWNVNYVIYEQQIWSVDRSGEGWRSMSDRGSDTANHYDHVHVSVY